MESFVSLLIDNKLQDKFGTFKTDFSIIELEILILPFPAIDERERSAVFTLTKLAQGEYEEKRWYKSVIWSDAPESMIYGVLNFEVVYNVFKKITFKG